MPSGYGEARRLAYFRILTQEALKRGPIDMETFLARAIERSNKMHDALERYVRSTGRMETLAVARNYSRFADSLELIKIESGRVIPTGQTVFFAHLSSTSDSFLLSPDEKMAFFFHIWPRLAGLREFVSTFNLSGTTSIKVLRTKLPDEHLAETYSEWLVDLGLAKPTGKTRGAFFLLDEGHRIGRIKDQVMASSLYAGMVLSVPVSMGFSLPSNIIWELVKSSSEALSPEVQHGFDKSIISALPVLMLMQLEIAKRHRQFFSIERLLDLCKKSLREYSATFKWDPLYRSGYIRFKRPG